MAVMGACAAPPKNAAMPTSAYAPEGETISGNKLWAI